MYLSIQINVYNTPIFTMNNLLVTYSEIIKSKLSPKNECLIWCNELTFNTDFNGNQTVKAQLPNEMDYAVFKTSENNSIITLKNTKSLNQIVQRDILESMDCIKFIDFEN